MAATTFLLFKDLAAPINALSDEDAGKLIKAIFAYENGESIPEMAPAVKVSFTFIKQQLERSQENYEAICERNRINGLKGGRPPKPKEPTGLSGFENKPNLTQANPTEPRITLPNPNPKRKDKKEIKNSAEIDPDDIPGFPPTVPDLGGKPAKRKKKSELWHRIQDNFMAQHPNQFAFKRENPHIDRFEEISQAQEDPDQFALKYLKTFYGMIHNGRDDCVRGQPYLPSILMSAGLWPRIEAQVNAGDKPIDPGVLEAIDRMFPGGKHDS